MSRAGKKHAAGKSRGVPASGPRARIMVATPTYTGELHHRFVESVMAATVYCLLHKIELELRIVAGSSLIQYARNQLVREFLEDESFTHLMWIDADVGFDPRAIAQLIEHEKDIVGGVYPMKCIPLEWPYEPMPGEQTTSLHRARVLPNGFMLCSRNALKTLADAAPTYWHHLNGLKYRTAHIFDVALAPDANNGGQVLLGEDIILCRKLIAAGFDVWCDPDISFSHNGQFRWGGNLKHAIEQQRRSGAPRSTLEALSSGDPVRMQVACDEMFLKWGNAWSPPGGELLALALLARESTRILEAGTGVSTLVMAAANPNAEIHALEHDKHWAERIRRECADAGLTNVTVYETPLMPGDKYRYEIPAELPESFDLAFLDGPPFFAQLENPMDSRRTFFAAIRPRIEGAVLVIDDIEWYRDIAAQYEHSVVGERFAVCKPTQKVVTSSAA